MRYYQFACRLASSSGSWKILRMLFMFSSINTIVINQDDSFKCWTCFYILIRFPECQQCSALICCSETICWHFSECLKGQHGILLNVPYAVFAAKTVLILFSTLKILPTSTVPCWNSSKNPGRKPTIRQHTHCAKAGVSKCTVTTPVKSLNNWINGFLLVFDGPKMEWIGRTEIHCFSFPFRSYETPQREVNLVTHSLLETSCVEAGMKKIWTAIILSIYIISSLLPTFLHVSIYK